MPEDLASPKSVMPSASRTGNRVVAVRPGYRLVHQIRDQKAWPNVSDVVLERLDSDALGEPHWVQIDSWCLSPVTEEALNGKRANTLQVAMKMLLDTGPIIRATEPTF